MLWHHFAVRLVLAVTLGAFIGAERQWRQRMAGLRTNALVATGAAMFVMLGVLAARPDDTLRIAGQVVTGIGFLGAGVILRNGLNITGLNTAATLWCSAAIGTLAGYGMYGSAITGAVTVIAANVCLRPIGKALNRGTGAADADITYLFQITARTDQEAHLRALLLHSLAGQPLLLKSLKSEDVEHTDKVEVQAILSSTGRQDSLLEQIVGRLSLEPGVSGVSWEIVAEHD
ncbi:MAG TPA: MgtC/SapB family protein [Chthoniobacterales bacterium]|nr:MgtC/SapB family protein [Chthoniobacterales bacterium]